MIQGVIARMAGNSAQIKTWTVSIITAVLAISGLTDDSHWLIGIGGCIAVIAFWTMDTGYLRLEKCYRKLHEAVVAGEKVTAFSLDYRLYATEIPSIWKAMWSWSIRWFYVTLLIAVIILTVAITVL